MATRAGGNRPAQEGGVVIVLATTASAPGGVWRHLRDLGLALATRGRPVALALPGRAASLRDEARAHGLRVLDGSQPPHGAIYHLHLADTFDRATVPLLWMAKRRGCTAVVTEHLPRTDASDTTLTDDPRRRTAWFAKTFIKSVQFRLSDATVAVSEDSARFLAVRYGRSLHEIDVIRNGVDLGDTDSSQGAAIADTPPVVTAAGAMLRQKGFDVLLHAVAASTGSWRLALAGEGPHLRAHRMLADELGIADRVDFLGWQPSGRSVFRRGRLVAVPSRWEAAPYVLLEAMSEARPIVATRFGGVDEVVVDGQTGVLVPVDDAASLARAIDSLLAEPVRCAALGRAGRARLFELEGLRVDDMMDSLESLYERVAQ